MSQENLSTHEECNLIGTHAGVVWNVLHEKGGMDLTQPKSYKKVRQFREEYVN